MYNSGNWEHIPDLEEEHIPQATIGSPLSLGAKELYALLQLRLLALSIMFTMFIGGVSHSFAQVTLTIPTDDIFTSINDWIATFAPIVAIGIGIAAAIAILTFVGKQIVNAFKA